MADSPPDAEPELLAEQLKRFNDTDLNALCEATDAAIIDGGGFGWVYPPGSRALETYFRGVLSVPERELFVARLNGDIVGSAILVRPPRNNEAQAFAASLMHSYIAPYARGHGLARMLTGTVEERARELGYHVLNLDVRETQEVAIAIYRVARLYPLGRASRICAGTRQVGHRLVFLQAASSAETWHRPMTDRRCILRSTSKTVSASASAVARWIRRRFMQRRSGRSGESVAGGRVFLAARGGP